MKSKSSRVSKPKKMRKSKSNKLFEPYDISTGIHMAMCRDLKPLLHEYDGQEHGAAEAVRRQACEFRKKFTWQDTDNDRLEKEAFEKFKSINLYMRRINRGDSFPSKDTIIRRNVNKMDKIHLRARALVHSVLSPFTEEEWFSACKHSAGSSLGVPFSDTSLEKKFTFPISSTSRAKLFFERYLEWDSLLHSSIKDFNGDQQVRYSIVEGSRATTVEKDASKRRFICVEPTANMFLQQGFMTMMYNRLKRFDLNVETLPDQHQKLAYVGSITGNLSTIDWTSASDCVGIELLRWLLPHHWFEGLYSVRCDYTTISGELTELHMFSSMGNAGTFPLETLVFWAYAHACLLTEKGTNSLFPEWKDLKSCSVFGDDCIVPDSITSLFIDVMESVGFIVNSEKSHFGSDRFRESCGGDYLAGYPTRPYSLRAPSGNRISDLESWLYIITNSLLKKYILYFGERDYVYDRQVFRLIFRYFRWYKLKIKFVPPDFPDDSGIQGFDLGRLILAYNLDFEAIDSDIHGTKSFLYKRYRYWKRSKKDAGIRYADWLKRPSQQMRKPDPWSSIRRRGGYVVARTTSCHWHIADHGLIRQALAC